MDTVRHEETNLLSHTIIGRNCSSYLKVLAQPGAGITGTIISLPSHSYFKVSAQTPSHLYVSLIPGLTHN